MRQSSVLTLIVEKACMTNPLFDNLRDRSEVDPKAYEIFLDLCEEAVENLIAMTVQNSPEIVEVEFTSIYL